ncbi:hypothetical protein [Methanosarcina horonobensis]|uniref:hypothetical protein n=1 Tax=Methanosarcina horonobensis TaxID=418008 RepID=UPI000AF59C10|nr:hypothetical protein [Methanosarcina horonobensis]
MQGKPENNPKTTVSSELAETLHQEGWKKMDLHVHSSCSYDVPPAKAMHLQFFLKKQRLRDLIL